jgi:hypothetical protein
MVLLYRLRGRLLSCRFPALVIGALVGPLLALLLGEGLVRQHALAALA